MTGIGSALLTWFITADTWLRLTAHAEPSAVVIVALVATVAALAVAAIAVVRIALRVLSRLRMAPRIREFRSERTAGPRPGIPVRPAGARGPRAPNGGSRPAAVAAA